MKILPTGATPAALLGVLFLLPLLGLNTIVANRIEPFFSTIRPAGETSPAEYVLLALALLVLPIGACVALGPTFARPAHQTRRVPLFNGLIAGVLIAVFLAVAAGWASDIYRCDILRIPNCD